MKQVSSTQRHIQPKHHSHARLPLVGKKLIRKAVYGLKDQLHVQDQNHSLYPITGHYYMPIIPSLTLHAMKLEKPQSFSL